MMHDLTVHFLLIPLNNSMEKAIFNLKFLRWIPLVQKYQNLGAVLLSGISKSTWLYFDLSTTVVPLDNSKAEISSIKISSKNTTESEFFLYKYAASQVIQSDPHWLCIMYVLLLYSPPCCAAICQYLCQRHENVYLQSP